MQEGHDQGPRQGDHRAARVFFRPRRAGGCDQEIGQTFKVALLQHHEPAAFIGQKVLREGGAEHGEAGFHLRQPITRGALQGGARAGEAAMGEVKDAVLFRGQVQGLAVLPERVDTGEEFRVVDDFRGIGRKFRGIVALHRFARVGRIGGGEVIEHARHLIEQGIRAFQRVDGVFETGRLGCVRDRLDRAQTRLQRRIEGGREMVILDLVKGRQAEGAGPVGQ